MRARSCRHLPALLVLVCISFAHCGLAQQQQQDEGFWDIDTDQPAAVPSIHTARRILQEVADGSYYGINEAGGYGYYGNNEAGGYGYYDSALGFGTRRSLIEAGTYGGYYGNNELGGYGYYGNNEAGGYYGTAARSMLQMGGEPEPAQQAMAEAGPVGQCYCRYEKDYNTWALGEEACKNSLYAKCKANSRLPCGWLDEYYGTSVFGAQRTGYGLPHESQISSFLFEDCTPLPPCGCSNVAFDGRDDAASSYKCCRDMRVHCRHPASGLSCTAVSAYCNNDKPSFHLAMWVDRALANAQCDAYRGLPYAFVPLEQQSVAASEASVKKLAGGAKAQLTAGAAESEEASEQEASASAQQQQAAVAPASGITIDVGSVLIAVGGGLVAAALVAAAFAARRQRLERAAAYQPLLLDEHVAAETGMGGQAIVSGLRQPPSAVHHAP